MNKFRGDLHEAIKEEIERESAKLQFGSYNKPEAAAAIFTLSSELASAITDAVLKRWTVTRKEVTRRKVKRFLKY